MTKNDTKLILQAFDELNDLLVDVMFDNVENPKIFDAASAARVNVLKGRGELLALFQKLLLDRD